MNKIVASSILAGVSAIGFSGNTVSAQTVSQPNIVVILADDMGFSDLGCYGSEISTPNLDRLAANGLRYTQFTNMARCCPSRACLLTGLYPHNAGMGWMTAADLGRGRAYQGQLAADAQTIPEALQPLGYRSYMTGKWHVTLTGYGDNDPSWPINRGFNEFYGTLTGSGSYFAPVDLYRDRTHIQKETLPKDFYYTDAISEESAKMIHRHAKEHGNQPMFLYVAFKSPHWPLHAKPQDIAKYKGKYDQGWEGLREQRFARQKELGLFDKNAELPPPAKDWQALTPAQKEAITRRMEVYAAQVDSMDQGVGVIIRALEQEKMMDNTFVMFMSDNGACSEDVGAKGLPEKNLGAAESWDSYRTEWANLSNTPFKSYKSFTMEGGIATSMIAHWPAKIKEKGAIRHDVANLMDLLPTFVDIAGGSEKNLKNPVDGMSMAATLTGGHLPSRTICWEHEANRAIRDGDWKLVATGIKGKWELYNLAQDRTECHNLADSEPQRVTELEKKWHDWAEKYHVLPLDGRGWGVRIKAYQQMLKGKIKNEKGEMHDD